MGVIAKGIPKGCQDLFTPVSLGYPLSVFKKLYSHAGSRTNFRSTFHTLKGGPEPLEKECQEILGSKREDRFFNPVFEVVQKTCQVQFSYLLRHSNFCKAPRTLRKFPQKCQKITGC